MIWKGRSKFSKQGDYKVVGGNVLLILICLFSFSVLAYEILRRVFI
ncbi:hypothetical protein PRO82_001425 [Candidatus Protochlamydia amoebophila]|nr:hypothetical protein [Candidatus Protochlamydia amoebophila]